jgi:hypothetical protein
MVAQKKVREDITRLQSKVGKVKFQYIEKQNAVTLNTAEKLGFQPTANTAYVEPRTFGKVERTEESI